MMLSGGMHYVMHPDTYDMVPQIVWTQKNCLIIYIHKFCTGLSMKMLFHKPIGHINAYFSLEF